MYNLIPFFASSNSLGAWDKEAETHRSRSIWRDWWTAGLLLLMLWYLLSPWHTVINWLVSQFNQCLCREGINVSWSLISESLLIFSGKQKKKPYVIGFQRLCITYYQSVQCNCAPKSSRTIYIYIYIKKFEHQKRVIIYRFNFYKKILYLDSFFNCHYEVHQTSGCNPFFYGIERLMSQDLWLMESPNASEKIKNDKTENFN